VKIPTCSVRVGPEPGRRPCGKPATAEVRRLGFESWKPVCDEHAAELRRRKRDVRPLPSA
jgi:hypothetical protein